MNNFSIPYPEYHIAGLLQNQFPKEKNFTVFIPMSRQQKHMDLLLYNLENKKSATIQVKSSRTYITTMPLNPNQYNYTTWLGNFDPSDCVDFYVYYIPYPLFDAKTYMPKAKQGLHVLVFDKVEMKMLLAHIKKTKTGKQDRFFYFGFNLHENRIFSARGFEKSGQEFTKNLLSNRWNLLESAMQ
jgi:hypothetical protein